MRVLIDSGSEVNSMTPAYTIKLGFKSQYIDVRAKKIDGPTMKTFGMAIASFWVKDKLERS